MDGPHREDTLFGKRFAILALIFSISLALLALSTSDAFAAKGGHRQPASTATGSFSLVLVDSTDGVAHWSQHITFNASSTATYYFVRVNCSQSGALVYQQSIGFYVGWPWTKNFTLMSAAWTGGAADCDALLYSTNADGTNFQSLATMTFQVSP